jgi:hypothetical protein
VKVTLAVAVFLIATAAVARPGGGQSFRSGSSSGSSGSSSSSWGSSRSSSGSSWSSSGSSDTSSSRSSGSWWGSSNSRSNDSSSSSGSSTDTSPGYRGSYDTSAAERTLAEARCVQGCIGKQTSEELNKCFEDCKNVEPIRSSPSPRYGSSDETWSASPEKPLINHFWIAGVVLGLVGVGGLVRHVQKRREEQFWNSVNEGIDRDAEFRFAQEMAKKRHPTIQSALAAVKSTDDGFSYVLFEDFFHALFVETHKLRGEKRLDALAPFLSQAARDAYAPYPADSVGAIIVGSLATLEVVADGGKVRVQLGFEANYTETRDGESQAYYAREIWYLCRDNDILSRGPKHSRVIGCGNCGAPLDKIMGSKCEHCGVAAGAGKRDWVVESIGVEARELRGPMLTGTTEEEGTDLPTLVAPDAKAAFAELGQRDPDFSWAAFIKRVELVFHTFHRTWSAQDLREVRAFLTDNLFDTQTYWVSAYQAQNLRNVTERPEIVSVQLSRLTSDKYYDAMSVRVFAQCTDYTLDSSNRVVGGSKDNVRQYSEYWTFIRAREKTGAPKTDPVCPSCGAPADHVQENGECKSCHVKVTNGAYDWTLSRIEQDEVYRL